MEIEPLYIVMEADRDRRLARRERDEIKNAKVAHTTINCPIDIAPARKTRFEAVSLYLYTYSTYMDVSMYHRSIHIHSIIALEVHDAPI